MKNELQHLNIMFSDEKIDSNYLIVEIVQLFDLFDLLVILLQILTSIPTLKKNISILGNTNVVDGLLTLK